MIRVDDKYSVWTKKLVKENIGLALARRAGIYQ